MSSWIESVESVWNGFNLAELKVDEAYLRVISKLDYKSWIYLLSEECYSCPYTKSGVVNPNKEKTFKLDVARGLNIKIFNEDIGQYAFDNETATCSFIAPHVGEFGIYNLTINGNHTCSFETDKDAVNIYYSMLLVFLILVVISISAKVSLCIWRKYFRSNDNNEATTSDQEKPAPVKKRLKSLDAFRGISIVLMIFVNSGGGKYWWLDHAPWNGLHFADLVFPSFLWIMGVCIPISIKSQIAREVPKRVILQNILWRSIKLFVIGLCLNSMFGPTFENLRIMGVLQRFGIGYFVAASIHTMLSKPDSVLPQGRFQRMFHDVITMTWQWVFAICLLIINFGIVYGLNVPGCPKGYLGPGGKHDMLSAQNCIGGAIGYIDKLVLGVSHVYQHPTAKSIYDSQAFDPEGLFGCLLTIFHVFIGMQCGITLLTFPEWQSRVKRWISWAAALGLVGGVLCLFSRENGWIPVNKNLWSLSFVLVTSSLAFILLTICFLIIDVKPIWSGGPFVEAGMNAIIMYVGHTVLHKMLPWHWRIGEMNTHFLLLLECTWNTVLWILIALYLHSKNIFYSL